MLLCPSIAFCNSFIWFSKFVHNFDFLFSYSIHSFCLFIQFKHKYSYVNAAVFSLLLMFRFGRVHNISTLAGWTGVVLFIVRHHNSHYFSVWMEIELSSGAGEFKWSVLHRIMENDGLERESDVAHLSFLTHDGSALYAIVTTTITKLHNFQTVSVWANE